MIGMPMGEHHDIDLFRGEAGGAQLSGQPAAIGPWHKAVRTIAGVEKDDFLARIDDGWRKAGLEPLLREQALAHQLLDIGRWLVLADDGPWPVDHRAGIENVRD